MAQGPGARHGKRRLMIVAVAAGPPEASRRRCPDQCKARPRRLGNASHRGNNKMLNIANRPERNARPLAYN